MLLTGPWQVLRSTKALEVHLRQVTVAACLVSMVSVSWFNERRFEASKSCEKRFSGLFENLFLMGVIEEAFCHNILKWTKKDVELLTG